MLTLWDHLSDLFQLFTGNHALQKTQFQPREATFHCIPFKMICKSKSSQVTEVPLLLCPFNICPSLAQEEQGPTAQEPPRSIRASQPKQEESVQEQLHGLGEPSWSRSGPFHGLQLHLNLTLWSISNIHNLIATQWGQLYYNSHFRYALSLCTAVT